MSSERLAVDEAEARWDVLRTDIGVYLLTPAEGARTLGMRFTTARRGVRDRSGIGLIAWATDFRERAPGVIPDSPIHLAVSATHWILAVCRGGTLATVRRGVFLRRLTPGAVYGVEATISPGRAVIRLPSGRSVTAVDERIDPGLAVQACFEVYEPDRAGRVRMVEVWKS